MSNLNKNESRVNVVRGSFRKGLVSRMVSQLKDWNNRRQAVRQLSMMPDSFLRDIGIERYQIKDVVNRKGAFAEVSVIRRNQETQTPAPGIKRAA